MSIFQPFLIALGAATAVAFAAAGPAHAEAGPATFLHQLDSHGITYSNPDRAVSAAEALCGLAERGEPGLELIEGLKTYNPGLTTDAADEFAALAADSFCPTQLHEG